jgi:hypothetical protein
MEPESYTLRSTRWLAPSRDLLALNDGVRGLKLSADRNREVVLTYARVVTGRAVLSDTGVSVGRQPSDVRKAETASACGCRARDTKCTVR